MKNTFIASILFTISIFLSFSLANAESLTKNDQLFREDLQYRLDAKLQNQITTVISRYKAKIATMPKSEANALTDSILGKIETILYKRRAAQSLDKTLAKKADNTYLAYTLLKFELILLK